MILKRFVSISIDLVCVLSEVLRLTKMLVSELRSWHPGCCQHWPFTPAESPTTAMASNHTGHSIFTCNTHIRNTWRALQSDKHLDHRKNKKKKERKKKVRKKKKERERKKGRKETF